MLKGLDYFPVPCHNEQAVSLIEAEFGLTGYAIIIKLLQFIYGSKDGYYIAWSKDNAMLFSLNNGISAQCNMVKDVVEIAVKREIFSQKLYEDFGILTSEEIQETFFLAVKRRKKVDAIREYLLVDEDTLPIHANIKPKNDNILPQSKEEKTKLKKSKVNHTKTDLMMKTTKGCVLSANNQNPPLNSVGEENVSTSLNSVIADKTKVSPNTLSGSNLGTPPNAVISDNLGTPPNTLGEDNPSVLLNSVIADKTRENYFELTGKPITSQNSKSSFIPDIQLINQSPLVNNENDDDFSRDFQGVLKTFAKAKSRKATSLESDNFKGLAREYGCSDLEQAMKKALLYDKLS
ncbi:MAG: DUF4373 domain-containing protein, partial [Clostridiales bacterium]